MFLFDSNVFCAGVPWCLFDSSACTFTCLARKILEKRNLNVSARDLLVPLCFQHSDNFVLFFYFYRRR